MTHQRNMLTVTPAEVGRVAGRGVWETFGIAPAAAARSGLLSFLTLLSPILLAACVGGPSPVPSIWPPKDFELVVEELAPAAQGSIVLRRFTVHQDGICVYAESDGVVGDPIDVVTMPTGNS